MQTTTKPIPDDFDLGSELEDYFATLDISQNRFIEDVLSTTRPTFIGWIRGGQIPTGPQHIRTIADLLGYDDEALALALYRLRRDRNSARRGKGVYISWSQLRLWAPTPTDLDVAA